MGTFGPHGLILCVSEGFLYQSLCVHNVDMETYDLHGEILYVSGGDPCVLLYIHIGSMGEP